MASTVAEGRGGAERLLRSAEQREPWERRSDEWLREVALRSAVEVATGRPIVDSEGDVLRCREDGHVHQHVKHPTAFRFRTYTCKARARCPHCARAYGEDQGAELHSLMLAAAERAGIPEKAEPGTTAQPLGWGLVVTLPREVSRHLGQLADHTGGGGMAELREEIKRIVRVVREYAARLLLGRHWRRAEAKQLGAALNVHWWSSRNPLTGGVDGGFHWHVHVMIPNARKDGTPWRSVAKFSRRRLDHARRRLRWMLHQEWGDLLSPSTKANVHARWYMNSKKGAKAWRHRARYDARHPWADGLEQARSAPGRVFADGALEDVRRLADRAESLQRLKTRRYVGYLVPGQRKGADLRQVEAGEDEWRPIENGYRRIVGMTSRGLLLSTVGWHENVTEVMGEDVVIERPPPRRWEHRRPDAPEDGAASGREALRA